MTGLIKYFARRKALARFAGREKGGALPLSAVTSVALYLDRNCPDWAACEREVRSYFESRNIEVHTIVLNPFDVDAMGRRQKSPRDPAGLGKEDMLISLVPKCSFTMTYEAMSSEAKCKIGIAEPKKLKVYDLVVRDGSKDGKTPFELFSSITDIFEKIR